MARQKKVILSGRIANVIFYEFRGKPCARATPARVKQTKATKASARQFGKASCMSRLLRSGLDSVLPDPKDKPMMYRLNNALLQWLLNYKPARNKLTTDLPFIDQFEFNEESLLSERLKLPLTIDWTKPGKIILDIPKLNPRRDITAPAYTETVHWKIAVTSCSDDLTAVPRKYTTAVDMEYNDKLITVKRITLPFNVQKDEITVVAVGLNYEAAKRGSLQLVRDKQWLPVGVIGGCFKAG